jgi:hypothetical protein
VAFSQLGKGLDTLAAKGAAYCFVDTAPAITEQTAAVLAFADLVLVPVRPIYGRSAAPWISAKPSRRPASRRRRSPP